MRQAVRMSTFLFSAGFHAVLFGGLYGFSVQGDTMQEETVYRVALAEPGLPAPAPVSAAPAELPVAEPVPFSVPESKSAPEPERKHESKKEPPKTVEISPRKKTETPASRKASKETQSSSPVVSEPVASAPGAAGTPVSASALGVPRPSQIGGLMAYETDDVDQRPSVVKNARVEYPRKARRLGLSGRVIVQLVVDTGGKPQACTIRSAEPVDYFEEAALSAARDMRFIPGKIQGRPVNTVVLIPFHFSLN